ncbi:sigma D regulator [Candidatus Marimicrobium litorale]|jgi:regulator of sigma D|uniref:Rsd/AlgQ family anti-sigma factor n=1 Tax=Candidatus Marimicrobium litorale TaxID=2518991 RepID=A0ABT3T6G6_9GAMM|nr:Rsd/AlgQ family anti-sigma factor [Candidatus Marimicrobium litorale]MCX2977863.1 Rsd/AlgQ family anti-sigma factor [Candidatus Marimicrobium litorale]
MPTQTTNPKLQFEAVESLLTRWLQERRALLGKYTEIVVTLDGSATDEAFMSRQSKLCELLVDYISAGHFEVFHELINEAEQFGDGSCAIAEKIMPAIGDTTEVILAYEEKYANDGEQREKLRRDLAALGEMLESRFQLEDQLIAGLHNRHRRLVQDQASLSG